MIERLLVANRGEIARRVFRTCRDLGIETVAVHSDADAALPFVREASMAVHLRGSTPADTYLRADLLVEAARRSGADAVHPGYGFLSENAGFARAVVAAGLTWVGPAPESIEQMGDKVTAKKLMAAAGVPVLDSLNPDAATETDLPLLVKASAGGGGRGMRIVRTLPDLAPAVRQAAAEAESAFGDPTVFIEPFVERGRHVEVQIWGDHDGNTVSVLGARDCSVQRRHQKVLEEAPPFDLPAATEAALFAAAREAGHAIGYVGVGTVEFLYDAATDRFWFLEMNTRLQVEHPVTEAVWGVDLVALQIAVAEGRTPAEPRRPGGHAVEARLYAEDPARGWQPQSGRLTRFEIPGVRAELEASAAYGIRVDAAYRGGDEVGTHYDPMVAKVVSWAPSREEAIRRLAGALRRARIHGVRTNRDLLVNVLSHRAFLHGDVATDFLDRHDLAELAASPVDERGVALSAFAASVAVAELARSTRAVQARITVGWRNVTSQPQSTRFALDGEEVLAAWYAGRDGYRSADLEARVVETEPGTVVVESAGVSRRFDVAVSDDQVDVDSSLGHVALRRLPRFVDPAESVAAGSLLAPMPATVVSLAVSVGDRVAAGDQVLVLEAMKMQQPVSAPHAGIVTDLRVTVGGQVAARSVLAVVQPEGDHDA